MAQWLRVDQPTVSPTDRFRHVTTRRCLRVAGVDEAGRGPWAGPVVAAAVILRRSRFRVRIDDSKRLTARQRQQAFDVICDQAEVGIGLACAEEIDQRNILQATLTAMRRAIDDLPFAPDLVLVDGTIAPPVAMPCRPIVHGDQRRTVISCASIVAKVVRDRLMDFYDVCAPHHGFAKHKGYGTAFHARQLSLHGPCLFHRRSFRPVRDALVAAHHVARRAPSALHETPRLADQPAALTSTLNT